MPRFVKERLSMNDPDPVVKEALRWLQFSEEDLNVASHLVTGDSLVWTQSRVVGAVVPACTADRNHRQDSTGRVDSCGVSKVFVAMHQDILVRVRCVPRISGLMHVAHESGVWFPARRYAPLRYTVSVQSRLQHRQRQWSCLWLGTVATGRYCHPSASGSLAEI